MCSPLGHWSNQIWSVYSAAEGGASTRLSTLCNGQKLCLTAHLRSPAPPTPPSPPPPPPPPQPTANTLFKPHDADVEGVCLAGMRSLKPGYTRGCPCWRIPSVVTMPGNVVIVFAEGRWMLGDGCLPVPTPPATKEDRRAIFSRRSTDGGRSFGPIHHVVGNLSDTGTAANPTAVFLPESKELLMHYDCGGGHKGPVCGGAAYGRTFQLRSLDLGMTWQAPTPLQQFLGVWDGVAPGEG